MIVGVKHDGELQLTNLTRDHTYKRSPQKLLSSSACISFCAFVASVNFFDYFGSIVSYMVVSIPLFTGEFDDLMPGELAAVVGKVHGMRNTSL